MPEPAVPPPRPVATATPTATAAAPSALRRAILVHLRRVGPSAPDAIATAIGASRSGVAQQLRALDSAGLVTRTSVRHGVGRPRHLYDVTADAQDLFPSNYDGLATGLLAAILEIGGDALVEDVFAARRRQAEAGCASGWTRRCRPTRRSRTGSGSWPGSRTSWATSPRRASTATASASWSTTARSWTSRAACPAACRAELDLFREVLGAEVVRERHIAAGDRCCEYRVRGADRRPERPRRGRR